MSVPADLPPSTRQACVAARVPRHGRRGLSPIAGAALLWASVGIFALLANALTYASQITALDAQISHWFHGQAGAPATLAMEVIAGLHSVAGIAALAALLAYHFIKTRRRFWLLTLAAGVPGVMALNLLLKHLFARARPDYAHTALDLTFSNYSFPSGHTAMATVLYGLAATYLAYRARNRTARVAIALAASAMVALVGMSRVYLGAHYPSDVLAAIAEGCGWLAACITASSYFYSMARAPRADRSALPPGPIRLRTALIHERDGIRYILEFLKLSLRALPRWRTTRRWMAFLNAQPIFASLLPAYPRLIHKIYRPYFSRTLRCRDRLAVLETHYRTMLAQGLASLIVQAAAEPLVLCSVAAKSPQRYRLQLHAAATMVREGELVLQLMREESLVYSLAFSVMPGDGGLAIGIGCVQGPPADGLTLGRMATRELYGMRPKNLLVRVVRQLGHDWGCQQLIMASNRNRIMRRTRQRPVMADYDGLWLELGAVCGPDGNYSLPCEALPAPCWDAIPSKKRSEARQRHAMLAAATEAIGAALVRAAPRY